MEETFGFIEYLVEEQESLGARYPLSSLRELRERLIRLIHHAVATSQMSRAGVYHRFWELAKEISLNISVITTNYDTLLDEAFDFLYPSHALIDYCIHFMNYEWYGDPDVSLPAFHWWVNPREPVEVWDASTTPLPVKIIKVHGSLNWHYCPSCGQVLLTPWATSVPGVHTAPETWVPDAFAPPGRCPWDGERFEALIVPPSHFKVLHSPVLARLRGEAAQEIRSAKRIVFVGYSFPPADVHLKALIMKNLPRDCEVVVVDPLVTDRIRAAYESLSRPTAFIPRAFQDALKDSTTAAAMFGHRTV